MSIRGLVGSFGWALIALLASSPVARAESYRDAAHHFAMDLPKGWEVMSSAELAQINAFVQQKMPGQVAYIQGFRPKGSALGSYPYSLVQLQAGNTAASYEEIEKTLARETNGAVKKVEGSLADLVKEISVGSAILDRTHNRILVRIQMTVAGVGPVQGISVGNIGSEGIVSIHSYALENDFARHVPTFNQMNDSFKFDSGYTFTPSAGFWQRIGAGALSGAAKGGIAGALIGLLVGGIFFVRKQLNKR